MKIECSHCKSFFKVMPHDIKKRKYCSNKCANTVNNKKMKRSLSWRTKLSRNRKGVNNPMYIHGKYPEHRRIRHSLEYRLWREAVFERDDYTCVLCGVRSSKDMAVRVEADHIKSFCDHPNLRFEISNGRTLCQPCHRNTDSFAVNRKI